MLSEAQTLRCWAIECNVSLNSPCSWQKVFLRWNSIFLLSAVYFRWAWLTLFPCCFWLCPWSKKKRTSQYRTGDIHYLPVSWFTQIFSNKTVGISNFYNETTSMAMNFILYLQVLYIINCIIYILWRRQTQRNRQISSKLEPLQPTFSSSEC